MSTNLKDSGIFREYLIGTDDFKQPKVVYGKKAIGILMCRLLLLEPGTSPMRPEMGVGLVSKYRYMFPDNLVELKRDIADQLNKYLFPYERIGVAMWVETDKTLRMDITIDDDTYKYVIEEQEDNRITIQELLDMNEDI